jgi:hypothetical protein
MGQAQERFKEATEPLDVAYWQGAIDGEAAERERNINLLEGWKERLTSWGWRIPTPSDLEKSKAVEYCVELIERGN